MSQVPVDRDEYNALTDRCGVVQLAGWSSITLTGNDRQTFLHNFCTNDIKRLAPGTSCEAFFTNVKGKIIGHGLVTCRDAELVIIGPPAHSATLAAHLDRYVIRENVAVRDTTSERSYILLAGGATARSLLLGIVPPEENRGAGQQSLVNASGLLANHRVHWNRWELLGRIFSGLLEVAASEISAVRQALTDQGAESCDESLFHTLRIEAGMPLFGVDFDDRNLPQEVGRNDQAISFTKGCYLGQETVARIDAMGHVNQQLAGVRFAGEALPEIGADLTDAGKTVGHVTSAAFSPKLDAPLALAMVRREHSAAGTHLHSPIGVCEVVALPV
jgi:folate-binding protein YgfZ